MLGFSQALFPEVQASTFLQSCGVADLVASCFGGRNRRVAEAYTRSLEAGNPKTLEQLEVRSFKKIAFLPWLNGNSATHFFLDPYGSISRCGERVQSMCFVQ